MAIRGNAVFKGIMLLFSACVCVVQCSMISLLMFDNIKIVLSGDLDSL